MNLDESAFKDAIVQTKDLSEWKFFMRDTLRELARITKNAGAIVIEVGEVQYKNELLHLDEVIADIGDSSGLHLGAMVVNKQHFTKLANCFGVSNNEKGTNTNHCVVLFKEKKKAMTLKRQTVALPLFENDSL
ncbi:MAG: DNA methyltransferase [Chlorobiales bacterium]